MPKSDFYDYDDYDYIIIQSSSRLNLKFMKLKLQINTCHYLFVISDAHVLVNTFMEGTFLFAF